MLDLLILLTLLIIATLSQRLGQNRRRTRRTLPNAYTLPPFER